MGTEILSQDDIDALLAAINQGEIDLQKDSDQDIDLKLQEKKEGSLDPGTGRDT